MESSIFLGFLPSTDTTIQNVFFSGWPVVTCCFTLTEEAVTPPRRGRVPLRRLDALAACVGLVLGLANYQALAVGVPTR